MRNIQGAVHEAAEAAREDKNLELQAIDLIDLANYYKESGSFTETLYQAYLYGLAKGLRKGAEE